MNPVQVTSYDVVRSQRLRVPTGSEDVLFLGVDIGGTKVSAGVVNWKGEILTTSRAPMVSDRQASDGFSVVRSVIDDLLGSTNRASVRAIGVSSPGPVDPHTGVVANPCNLPCWRDFPLKDEIERAYRMPAAVDNDANAAGLAEAIWGSAAEYRTVFYATIGTGIGTGIVFDHSVYRGPTGAAGEGGHMSINYTGETDCSCGKPGCVEAMISGPAIARRARTRIALNPRRGQMLLDLAAGNLFSITCETVGEAWRAGDPLATEILQESANVLAVWFGNLIDLLEPEVVVVGGGVAELMSNFFEQIAAGLPKWCVNQHCRQIPLRLARYRADAGIAGGAALCLCKFA
jgi:glucokinase